MKRFYKTKYFAHFDSYYVRIALYRPISTGFGWHYVINVGRRKFDISLSWIIGRKNP